MTQSPGRGAGSPGSTGVTEEADPGDRPPARTAASPSGAPSTSARSQIRGSSLLLVGRAIAMAVNFVVQVLTVRYLTKTDYGAFAYALSIVDLGQMIATFGMDRTITRFLSIDDEERRYDRLFGTLVFALATVGGLGLAVVLFVDGLQSFAPSGLAGDGNGATLLVILIVLAPIQAFDSLLTGVLSVFASPSSIFVRRFVVAPGLKLAVITLLVLSQAGVQFLAWGYVIAGLIGIVVYGFLLARLLRVRGLWERFRPRHLELPVRELVLFTIPLLTTDLVYIVLNTSDAILLGWFRGAEDVAAFRVVIPAAGLNQLVFSSFTLLFVPAAARLFARNDREGVRDLYWQTAIWMAVISFPLFALTFSLAGEVTRTLYGERYAGSSIYLAMLSFAYYFNTALGFNGLTLRVYGAMRSIVLINVAAAVLNLALNLILIPTYGPLGAAIGTTTTLIVHNVLKQVGLNRATGISLFDPRYLRVYVVVAAGAAGLFVAQAALGPLRGAATVAIPFGHVDLVLVAELILAAVVSIVVFILTRSELRIEETLPELARIPILGRLVRAEDVRPNDD